MKNIVVTAAGTGDYRDLQIEPGTTAQDILNELGFQNYFLIKDDGQYRFGATENVYPAVSDGEKLYATSKADVAGIVNSSM